MSLLFRGAQAASLSCPAACRAITDPDVFGKLPKTTRWQRVLPRPVTFELQSLFDGAADLAQMLPKRVRWDGRTLSQIFGKLQLLSQSFAAVDSIRLLPFRLRDVVCSFE